MNNHKLAIDKFYLSNPDRTRKFVSAFNYGPDEASSNEQIGFLLELEYQLIPTPEDMIWAKELNEQLITLVKEKYYSDHSEDDNSYHRFESFLQEINQLLAGHDFKNKSLNLLLAAFNLPNVYFAQVGTALAYLYQDQELVPLIKDENNKTRKFSNIISGVLEDNDQLFFATKNLFDYLPQSSIERKLKTGTELSTKDIQTVLKKTNDQSSLGLMIIKNKISDAETEKPKIEVLEPERKEEVQEIKSEKIDEKITKPVARKSRAKKSVVPDTTKPVLATEIIEKKDELKKNTIEIENQEIKEELIIKNKTKKQSSTVMSDDEVIRELTAEIRPERFEPPPPPIIFRILIGLGKMIIRIFAWLIKISGLKFLFKKIIAKFNRFSYLQRALIVLLLIIAIVLVQGIVVLARKEFVRQNQSRVNDLVQQIKDKQGEVNAAIIYKDETKTQALIKQLNDLLTQFSPQTTEQRDLYNQIKEELAKQTTKVYHQEENNTLKIIADLSKLDSKIQLNDLAKIDNILYSFNPINNAIYQIDLSNNQAKSANQGSSNIGYLRKITTLDQDSLLFTHSNGGLATYNIRNKNFSSFDLQSSQQNLTIQDFLVYSDKLYILDNKNSQIFKYAKTASGFGREEKWLTAAVNLNNAISLAADGALYVLFDNGSITKFYRGAKQDFAFKNIIPAIQKPTKIFTSIDAKYIYVLEPSQSRLIVFNKTGDLIKQISAPELTNTTNFVVSSKEDLAWLLNDKKIFEIGLK